MNSEMKRRNFAIYFNSYDELLDAMVEASTILSNIRFTLADLAQENKNLGPLIYKDIDKAKEFVDSATDSFESFVDFERSDFSRQFASEAGVVGLLIDQLANSMEFFDEEGWVEFLGPDLDEDSAREIYKNYWLISPNDRLKWNDSQWGTWLERYI